MDPAEGCFARSTLFEEATRSALAALSEPSEKVNALVQRSAQAEGLLLGELKDALYELSEAQHWQFAGSEDVERERTNLLTGCDEQLGSLKLEFLTEMARELEVLEEYKAEIKKPENHLLGSYERLGELAFALLVWRQNLRRGLRFAESDDERLDLVRQAYKDADQLVRRCLDTTNRFWNTQIDASVTRKHRKAKTGSPRCGALYSPRASTDSPRRKSISDMPLGGSSVITLYEKTMDQVKLRLEAVAKQHGVSGLDAGIMY